MLGKQLFEAQKGSVSQAVKMYLWPEGNEYKDKGYKTQNPRGRHNGLDPIELLRLLRNLDCNRSATRSQ